MQFYCITGGFGKRGRFDSDTVKMLKEKRQQKIRNLIRTKRIGSQNELAELLSAAGFTVNQSSVSRDLDELNVIKAGKFYALPEVRKTAVRFGLTALETAGANLIVARCDAGLASAVAVRIDDAGLPEIVGTIAGDDTIFVAVKTAKAQKAAMKKLWEIFRDSQ